MKFSFSKKIIHSILFTLCVAVPYLNNYELTFLVWSATMAVSLRRTYSKQLLIQVGLFTLILGIALFSSFFQDFGSYDFIRDITYLAKPIIGLLVGYQLCRNSLKDPLQTVIYTGVLLAIFHLFIVFYGIVFVGFRNIHQIRGFAGFFSDFEIYVIILLLFSDKFGVALSRNKKSIFLTLLVLSSAFYLSRTNFLQFGILFLAMKGYFVPNRRNATILFSLVLAGLVAYSAILYYNPKRNGKGIEAFLYKVKIAPTEPFKTKINTEDYKDFNDNYRSVENINTYRQMRNDGAFSVLFGKGLGSKVDLKKEVWLDDASLRYISILHNGFMTVYLKSGIFGLILLSLSIFLLFRKQITNNQELTNLNYLITGTALFLFISYWVFMGFYFKADTKAILVGLLIALSERISSQKSTQKILE
ncbi:hypothetical protein EQG68_05175 [Flavobacterium piscinae]|uniref:O-antigen ligase domain-containing protein n=1 Tax=Flavobacterium piscinae TaxID=2506424 RepID=A0A4Q1KW03_9FLAO|nr:hypothetical protein [Flavobacterium piscinae]RXR33619.1 hypothetical protein EQG68_05175 [Flavobacterium piscinae]